ncbi:hypothetical protein B0H16DRAFT_1797279 [Mycena metata]|uniref:Uncharacterized protein n=1 Tax=Mycena metata TaxID=1033252 RepID=A0AAD7MIK8_9AGAR|nr:hypothetical protein B0H16DRAFT_1797279 [Mycena metata]
MDPKKEISFLPPATMNEDPYFENAPTSPESYLMDEFVLEFLFGGVVQRRNMVPPVDLRAVAKAHPAWPQTTTSPEAVWWASHGYRTFEIAVSLCIVRWLKGLALPSGHALSLAVQALSRKPAPSLLLRMCTGLRLCPPFDLHATFFVMIFHLDQTEGVVGVQRWVERELMDIIRPVYARAALFDENLDPKIHKIPAVFVELREYWYRRDRGEITEDDTGVAARQIKGLPKSRPGGRQRRISF